MTQTRARWSFVPRVTLIEAIAIVSFVGLSLAAMRMGGVLADVATALAGLAFVAMLVDAFVGRGENQAFAIGFVLACGVYAASVIWFGASELDPFGGKLPTTRALRPLFVAMRTREYVDMGSGADVAAAEAEPAFQKMMGQFRSNTSRGFGSGVDLAGMGPGMAINVSGRSVSVSEFPVRRDFMTVGHAALAVALGYAFGRFGEMIYRRRESRPQSPSIEETSP